MLGNNQFENFIIKKIVNGVFYDTTTLSLYFNKVVVSDKMMSEIYSEANNYGYSKEEVTLAIESALRRISQIAHKETVCSNTNLSNLAVGQHLKIVMYSPDCGVVNLELLNLSKGLFLVLSSDDYSLMKDDELISCSDIWNVNACIKFTVFRNKVRFPNNYTIYKTYPVLYLEFIYPSSVYEVYDSESDFRFMRQKEETDTTSEQQIEKLYSWYPAIEQPMTAFLETDISADSNAPYVIRPDEEGGIATFYLNTEWLSISPYHLTEFIKNQRSGFTYELQNKLEQNIPIRRFKVLKRGVLKRILDAEIGKYVWVVKKKMLLKVYY